MAAHLSTHTHTHTHTHTQKHTHTFIQFMHKYPFFLVLNNFLPLIFDKDLHGTCLLPI